MSLLRSADGSISGEQEKGNLARMGHLDSLRGLAASLVVVQHYLATFYPYVIFGNQGPYRQQEAWEDMFFYPPFGLLVAGHFAVSLFFILSGYVLSYRYWGQENCRALVLAAMVKRPIRLGGLVLFTVVVGAGLWGQGLLGHNAPFPLLANYWQGKFAVGPFLVQVATSLFSVSPFYNPPLWTITIELYGSMLVFAFVFLFARASYRLALLLALLVLFQGSMYQGFILGMMVADVGQKYRLPSSSGLKIFIYFGLTVFFLYFSSYPYFVTPEMRAASVYGWLPPLPFVGGAYSMLAAFFLMILVGVNPRVKSWLDCGKLRFLGRISYGLYAVHFLILSSFSSAFFLWINQRLDYGWSFVVVFLLSLPLVLGGAVLAEKYIDVPSIKLAARIGKYVGLLAAVAVGVDERTKKGISP